jgi:UDP-N-acetylglucosamine--N-acetylmuramyl-(pentapeptide) pyrophosphoryl-undecaprenol N-acetylglucosamine transferase
MTIGIAAAGSGGHVYPALAVAEVLTSRGVAPEDIVFFGGDRMEADVIPAAGFPFVAVDIHGIRRSLSVDNLTLPLKVRTARNVIVDTIRRRNIEAMVVFGGYVAGPAALAASKTGIPLIVHEANAQPGIANRLIARKADTVFASYAPALSKLPMAEVVGSPLRSAFGEFNRDESRAAAREHYGVSQDSAVLGIVGGSLGAAALNQIARALASQDQRSFEMIHICGQTHAEEFTELSEGVDGWIVRGYEEDMPMLYAAADLVLSRGGAMTVAELHATRTPAVVVPLPAGGAYQGMNAIDAVDAGGFVVVDQSDTQQILDTVTSLLNDPDRLEHMSAALADSPHLSAATIVAERVLEVSHGR